MLTLLLFCTFILFDAEFLKIMLDIDDTALQKLVDSTLSPEQDIETFSELANKLARWVPQNVLEKHLTTTFPPSQGKILLLKGNVIQVIKYKTMYCCKMKLENGMIADIFVSTIPKDWKHNVPIQERAAAYGMYVKSFNAIPVFAAPAIRWFPDTFLGNLGFNVGLFDQVATSRVTELEKNDLETNRRIFKFTDADWEPFYSLLKVVSETPAGWLEEESRKHFAKSPISVTDLFNRPQETRGNPVLLRGIAKRIVKTEVQDQEAKERFSIDCYYQIYLYTSESQGNPIVICVRSLPENTPVGDAADFSEEITVAAIPYKLWIYETSNGNHYAPILVGRSVTWHPKSTAQSRVPKIFSTFSYTAFFILILLWFACRYWFNRPARDDTSIVHHSQNDLRK